MNPLFTLPLHGIRCIPSTVQKSSDFCTDITLKFCKISVNPELKPIWQLKDQGQRYISEISLFEEKVKDKVKNTEQNVEQNQVKSANAAASYLLKVNCQGSGVFKIDANTISIDWQANGTDSAHYFQTLTAALYLELNHVLCIHANALAYNDHAIAFVAPSRTGKTTLTAALNKHGFKLMTDDMMALHQHSETNEYTVYPSWPVARMWPDTLTEVLGEQGENCEKVHANFAKRIVTPNSNSNSNSNSDITFDFCQQAKKLKVMYLLQRDESAIDNTEQHFCRISNISTAEAVIILLKNSILGSAYSALGLESARVKALAKLVHNVPFKQVSYSSGKSNLNNVCNSIKQDIQK
jgi:hypothetical protein